VIDFEGVSKWYFRGTANEVLALDDVHLHCPRGQWVTIIGSNGAGKSTLVKVIAGLTLPDRGTVRLGGRTVTRSPDYKRAKYLGRIDQNPIASTAPDMTIAENLAMAHARGQRRGLRKGVTPARKKLFREALGEIGLGLENRLSTLARNLSGGQRQALGLVMATIAEPNILLLDEHAAALDPRTAVQVMQLTEIVIRKHELTTVMVTHNMQHAIRWGDRLLMMHLGRIILDISGEKKAGLTIQELVQKFHEAAGDEISEDRLILA
jgi:putative ABC transport system ATP-binding protein